jgi:hypothetical protein
VGFGYAFISGSQTRINLQTVSTLEGEETIGIIAASGSVFKSPLPLETRTHALAWSKAGYGARMNVNVWRKSLRWNGFGAKQAAEKIRKRWTDLMQGASKVPPIPGVMFPPVEDATVSPVEDWREAMEVLRQEIADLRQRVEVLEFIP